MKASKVLTPAETLECPFFVTASDAQNMKLKKGKKRESRSLSSIYSKEDFREVINGSNVDPKLKKRRKREKKHTEEDAKEEMVEGVEANLIKVRKGNTEAALQLVENREEVSVADKNAKGEDDMSSNFDNVDVVEPSVKEITLENCGQNLLEEGDGLRLLAYAALELEGSHELKSMSCEGIKKKKIKKRKKKMNGACESNDTDQKLLEDVGLVFYENPDTEGLRTVENYEETNTTKRKVKTKKKLCNASVINELDRKPIRVTESALQAAENHAEENASQKIQMKKRKKKPNAPEGSKPFGVGGLELPIKGNLEATLQKAENREAGSAVEKKTKRKKKRHNSPQSYRLNQKSLQEAIQELLVPVKRVDAQQTTVKHKEMIAIREKIKRKEKMPNASEVCDLDGKPFGNGRLESRVKRKLKTPLGTAYNHEKVGLVEKRIKRKKKCSTDSESNDLDDKMLEDFSTEVRQVKLKPDAHFQTADHAEGSTQKKVKRRKKGSTDPESNDPDQKTLEDFGSEGRLAKLNPNALFRTAGHAEGSTHKKIKRRKKGSTDPESNDPDHKMLEDFSLEARQVKLKPDALFRTAGHAEGSTQKKVKRRKKTGAYLANNRKSF